MKLTGFHIHQSFCRVCPQLARPWSAISREAKRLYSDMARELNNQLGDDAVTVTAVRCNICGEMLDVEHAEGHACWLEDK